MKRICNPHNYLPYGEDWVESNHFSPDDTTRLGIFRFNGKENDHESGLHYYGARYYWSEALTGWLSVDPMADKYPCVSSYAYCAWNPVKLVDPNGDSIAVLLADNAVMGLGHLALLIQHDDKKWYLYSKNGERSDGNLKTVSGVVVGTGNDCPMVNPKTGNKQGFRSVEDFLCNTNANSEKHDGIGFPYYTQVYIIPTSSEQDKIIKSRMEEKLNEGYNLILNNCSEAVVSALENAGVSTCQTANMEPMNSTYQAPVSTTGLIPIITFFKIKQLNSDCVSVQ